MDRTVNVVQSTSTVATLFSLCVPLSMAHSPIVMGIKNDAGMNMRISQLCWPSLKNILEAKKNSATQISISIIAIKSDQLRITLAIMITSSICSFSSISLSWRMPAVSRPMLVHDRISSRIFWYMAIRPVPKGPSRRAVILPRARLAIIFSISTLPKMLMYFSI